MAKGYWIARIDVHDPEGYKDYVAAAKPAFEHFGARFLARGGQTDAVEGSPGPATSSSSFPLCAPRRIATTRPTIRPRRRSVSSTPSARSCLSRGRNDLAAGVTIGTTLLPKQHMTLP